MREFWASLRNTEFFQSSASAKNPATATFWRSAAAKRISTRLSVMASDRWPGRPMLWCGVRQSIARQPPVHQDAGGLELPAVM